MQSQLTRVQEDTLRDSIIDFIFCDDVPTFKELKKAGKLLSKWQVSEEYENYDYSLIMQKIEERLIEFKTHLQVLKKSKDIKDA